MASWHAARATASSSGHFHKSHLPHPQAPPDGRKCSGSVVQRTAAERPSLTHIYRAKHRTDKAQRRALSLAEVLIAIHVCAADITHHVAAMARHLIAAVLLLELQAALGAGAHEDACDLGLGELPKSVGRRCIATNGAARTASALARRLGSPLPISAPGNGVPPPHLARAKVGAPPPTSAPGPGSRPAQHLHRNLGVVPLPRRH
jgi:hypothetical protein